VRRSPGSPERRVAFETCATTASYEIHLHFAIYEWCNGNRPLARQSSHFIILVIPMSTFAEAPRITPFLWFDGNAEEAADFYVSIFPNSRRVGELRNPGDAPGPKEAR